MQSVTRRSSEKSALGSFKNYKEYIRVVKHAALLKGLFRGRRLRISKKAEFGPNFTKYFFIFYLAATWPFWDILEGTAILAKFSTSIPPEYMFGRVLNKPIYTKMIL